MTGLGSSGRKAFRKSFSAVVLLAACIGLVANVLTPSAAVAADPALTISDVSVDEGDSGTSPAIFTVTLNEAQSGPVTVVYTTDDGTATQPSDYTLRANTLTFAPGETTKTVSVPVVGDTVAEPNETFTVVLSNPVGADITDDTGVATIVNDDGTAPSLAIGDASVTEGDAGSVFAHFTITRTNAPATEQAAVTVTYATADGTATSASGDYTPATGTVTFAPTDTTKIIDVAVHGDLANEVNERFFVNLSNPFGATISDSQGVGTIVNDDDVPTLAIGDVTADEGSGGGTTTFTFPVTLSAASGRTVAVDYATANGTANATDYTPKSGTVSFSPGEVTKNITVLVTADNVNEANETFTVNLSNPTNATIEDGQGTGTITNDDAESAISISDETVTEGDAGAATATFTVSLDTASNQTVTAAYATANDTATAPADYAAESGTVTFAPGETSKLITVEVQGDTLNESNETYFVNLSAPTNGTIEDGQGVGTITDDDGQPALSIDDVTVSEGAGAATFTVTLAPVSGSIVTVNYTTIAGTATGGSDYTGKSGTLTFQPGESTKTININILQDSVNEADETFTVRLSSPTGATIDTANGTGTITDDDDQPGLSISSDSTPEGDSGTTDAAFIITLSAPSTQTVTVDYATADGTAIAPTDYTPTSGTVTFTPGQTTKTVNVPIAGDTTPEFNETFVVNLSDPTNATVTDGQGTGTITNDDGPPASLSINDDTVAEGDAGNVNATFTVSLAAAATTEVTVNYATADGTAKNPGDYTTTSGELTFAPGETTKTISVPVVGDLVDETNEHFFVNLTEPSANAVITDPQGKGTITDDDEAAGLSVDDVTVTEGNAGTTNATFTVTLSPASEKTVTVNYATANGTATQPTDYAPTSGDLTFAPNETSKTVDVPVVGDLVDEANETFFLNLTEPANAGLTDAQGKGTITDDDGEATLSVDDISEAEGDSATSNATFTVTLSTTSGQPVTVNYATSNVTATQPSDYTATSGELTFAPGETVKTVDVPVVGDTAAESTETFVLTLSEAANATIADGTGEATITDDDAAPATPSLAVDNVTVTEGNSGTVNAVFTVTKTGSTTETVTVHYATADGTATQPSDYASTSGDLTFAAGETTKTFAVPVNGDALIESTETFTVTLTAPTNATISDASGVGTIATDDTASVIRPQITTGPGAGGGPHVRTFAGPFASGPTDAGGFFAYETGFAGGVRVARGDFDADGKDEIVTTSGPGRAPIVRVWSATGALIHEFAAYGSNFQGGVFVAVGDVTGDATPEIITGPGAGGGPHVRVFGPGGTAVGGFFAYESGFTGGVVVAAGPVLGSKSNIVTGPGAGGGPHVKIFDGAGTVAGGFMAYETGFSGGVFVAAGEGRVVTSPGAGGGPHVKVFNGAGSALAGFFAYESGFTGGVHVAVGNLDDVNGPEIVTGPGAGGGPHVKTFGLDGASLGGGFFAYAPTFTGGVYVAAGKA